MREESWVAPIERNQTLLFSTTISSYHACDQNVVLEKALVSGMDWDTIFFCLVKKGSTFDP